MKIEKLFIKGISKAIFHHRWLEDVSVEKAACLGCRSSACGQRHHDCLMLGRTEWVAKSARIFCKQILPFDVVKQAYCLRIMGEMAWDEGDGLYENLKAHEVLRFLGGDFCLPNKVTVWMDIDWGRVAAGVRKLEREELAELKTTGKLDEEGELGHKYYDPMDMTRGEESSSSDDSDDSAASFDDDEEEEIVTIEDDEAPSTSKKARIERNQTVKHACLKQKKRMSKIGKN